MHQFPGNLISIPKRKRISTIFSISAYSNGGSALPGPRTSRRKILRGVGYVARNLNQSRSALSGAANVHHTAFLVEREMEPFVALYAVQ